MVWVGRSITYITETATWAATLGRVQGTRNDGKGDGGRGMMREMKTIAVEMKETMKGTKGK